MHELFDFEEVELIYQLIIKIKNLVIFWKILLPLLLEDKVNIVEKYLAKCPAQQKLFVSYIDKMCAKDVSMSSNIL